jgi:hypothetical protein
VIGAVILSFSAIEAGRTTVSLIVIRLGSGDAGRAVSFGVFVELSISRINMNILKVFIKERKSYCISKILGK